MEVAEQFLDGLASEGERATAFDAAGAGAVDAGDDPGAAAAAEAAADAASVYGLYYANAATDARLAVDEEAFRGRVEAARQCAFLSCIFGNPFRPVTLLPSWQTPTIVTLAHATYENRILPAGTLDTARLAVLADALEEAGCDNADMLNHCRQRGEHVRGCWVLDLLLGKE